MKNIVFELTPALQNLAFPTHRVKTHNELMEICIRTCRELHNSPPIPDIEISINTVALVVRKMIRLFFFSEKKYISIALPLTVQYLENRILKFYNNLFYIDSEIWSWLIAMCVTPIEELCNQEDFIDFEYRCEEKGIDINQLFKTFKEADYGYIRYDIDPDGAKKAKEKGRPYLHPHYHCDIHLSNNATFKTGYIHSISPSEFIELLDNESDRWYMVPATKAHKLNNSTRRTKN